MGTAAIGDGWQVTPEKILQAVDRIVSMAHPLKVILFGSRARGDYRDSSDVDIAVVIDASEEKVRSILPSTVLRGLKLDATLVIVSRQKFDLHRPWQNSIFCDIDREGVILYDRDDPKSARRDAVYAGTGRRIDTAISAA